MSKLKWDEPGEHIYETGVSQGVLYPISSSGVYTPGVVWNGLTSIAEKPSGAEATALWADDRKYLNLVSAEEFGATIEAYTYPDEFYECDGSAFMVSGLKGLTIGQQSRKIFGLCYKTKIGNDIDSNEHGYKLHLVYGCLAAPSEKNYQTENDSPEAITFSWEVSTTPVTVSDVSGKKFKPTALLTIDSTKVDPDELAALEEILYGTDATEGEGSEEGTPGTDPRLPLPDEVVTIVKSIPNVTANE